MNNKEMSAKWKQLKGEAKIKWGKLTDDDLDRIAGNRDKLVGRLQELYNRSRAEIEHEVDHFTSSQPEEGESKNSGESNDSRSSSSQ